MYVQDDDESVLAQARRRVAGSQLPRVAGTESTGPVGVRHRYGVGEEPPVPDEPRPPATPKPTQPPSHRLTPPITPPADARPWQPAQPPARFTPAAFTPQEGGLYGRQGGDGKVYAYEGGKYRWVPNVDAYASTYGDWGKINWTDQDFLSGAGVDDWYSFGGRARPGAPPTSTQGGPTPPSSPTDTRPSTPAGPTIPAAPQPAPAVAPPGSSAPAGVTWASYNNFGPGNDLRSTQINPVFEPKYQDEAVGLIRNARVRAGAPIAATDTSEARRLYGAAEQSIQGATLREPRSIAGTDLTGARSLAQQAQQAILSARLKDFYRVDGPDFTGANAALAPVEGDINAATVAAPAGIAGGTYGASPEAQAGRAAALQFLQRLSGTPNRSRIAQDRLDLFNERSDKTLRDQLEQTGQANAAMGRLGSGMVRDDLRGAVTEIDRTRSQYQKELAADTADQELSDELNRLNAGLSASTTFGNEDRANAGVDLTLRNEARSERDALQGYGTSAASLALARAAARQQLAGTRAGMATRTYDAAAGERDRDLANSQAQAGLELSRGGALAGQADQAARFAGVARSDAESDRAYDLGYDSTKAGIALNRGAALERLGGSNLDLARVLRADQVGERDYLTDVNKANAGLDLSKADALSGIDNVRFGQGAEMRGEVRGERDYQSTLAQLAIDNAARRAAMEDQLQSSAFNRQMSYLSMMLQASQAGGNGSGAMDSAAQLAYINEMLKRYRPGTGAGAVGTTYSGKAGGLA